MGLYTANVKTVLESLSWSRGIYRYSCPNCGRSNTESRLYYGLPCPRCLPSKEAAKLINEYGEKIPVKAIYEALNNGKGILSVCRKVAVERDVEAAREVLERFGASDDGNPVTSALKICENARGYERIYSLHAEAEELERFFERAIGSQPWGAQRTWIKRIVRGDSFSIIAPTGTGKTTFGAVVAVYLACRKDGRSFFVVPTSTLAKNLYEKVLQIAEKTGCGHITVLGRFGRLSPKAREELDAKLRRGDFHIAITTAAYMVKNAEGIAKGLKENGVGLNLVFADDVDAVIKSSKSVDAILKLVGFEQHHLELGEELLSLIRLEARLESRLIALRRRIERLRRRRWEVERRSNAKKNEGNKRLEEELKTVESELEKLELEHNMLSKELTEKVKARIKSIRKELEKARSNAASLVVSTATGRPRGRRVRLFRVLLGFEAGGGGDIGLRNIIDSYVLPGPEGVEGIVLDLVSRLRDGILVFVPMDEGAEKAEELAKLIEERVGVKARAVHAKLKSREYTKILDEFKEGEVNVIVGVATYYGLLVRGLDMPTRAKYAIFAGVPRHRFTSDIGDPYPARLLRLLTLLAEARPPRELSKEEARELEEFKQKARRLAARLRRLVREASPQRLRMLAEEALSYLRGPVKGETSLSHPVSTILEAYRLLREALGKEYVWEALSTLEVGVSKEDGKPVLLVPDAPTYVQASGRTSRLYAGGITLGLSIVVVDDERVFEGLKSRLRLLVETEWLRLYRKDGSWFFEDGRSLESVRDAIEEERRKVVRLREAGAKIGNLVKSTLLVVESPNKARTIARFFGQPSVRIMPGGLRVYEVSTGDRILMVAASGGHVYDLAKSALVEEEVLFENAPKELGTLMGDVFGVLRVKRPGSANEDFIAVYTTLKRCGPCGYQYVDEGLDKCPRKWCNWADILDSKSTLEDLRLLAWEADEVLIGTDPDTEGEKIGWDVLLTLIPYNRNYRRLEFHEVTKKAILEALKNPRSFDWNLVDAQIVRRVEDRWIGFTISPLLWCHFWPKVYCASEASISASPSSEEGQELEKTLPYYEERMCKPITRGDRETEVLERLGFRYRPNFNLSAGRVQTPVLKWIVNKSILARRRIDEAEITVSLGDSRPLNIVYRPPRIEAAIHVIMGGRSNHSLCGLPPEYRLDEERLREYLREYLPEEGKDGTGGARLEGSRIVFIVDKKSLDEIVRNFRDYFKKAKTNRVEVVLEVLDSKIVEVDPPSPYTTDTLLLDANRYLRLSAPETMRLAQDLFEWGLITYHRTDSTRVSERGIFVAREWLSNLAEREGLRLEDIFAPRTWGEGGAHEAIRPVRPVDSETLKALIAEGELELERFTERHARLYDLIFRRFMASQMRKARVKQLKVRVSADPYIPPGYSFTIDVPVAVGVDGDKASMGFALIFREGVNVYPELSKLEEKGKTVALAEARVGKGNLTFYYTQGEVVQKMKRKRIGRPSTYAKIIEVLLSRGYVAEPPQLNALVARRRGIWTCKYLNDLLRTPGALYDIDDPSIMSVLMRIPDMVSEERTSQLQDQMDAIERGEAGRRDVLARVYSEVAPLASLIVEAERAAGGGALINREGRKKLGASEAGAVSRWKKSFIACVSMAMEKPREG